MDGLERDGWTAEGGRHGRQRELRSCDVEAQSFCDAFKSVRERAVPDNARNLRSVAFVLALGYWADPTSRGLGADPNKNKIERDLGLDCLVGASTRTGQLQMRMSKRDEAQVGPKLGYFRNENSLAAPLPLSNPWRRPKIQKL